MTAADAAIRHDWHTHFARALAALNHISDPASNKAEIHLCSNHRCYKPAANVNIDYKPLFLGLKDAHIDRLNVPYACRGAGAMEETCVAARPTSQWAWGVVDVRAQGRSSMEDIQALAPGRSKSDPRIPHRPESPTAASRRMSATGRRWTRPMIDSAT